jgi:sugar phosphate isomerase/epimerase
MLRRQIARQTIGARRRTFMNRRAFLTGTAASAAAIAGAGWAEGAQGGAPAAQAPAAPAAAGRGRGPAPVGAAKLARVSLMSLMFGQYRSDTAAAKTSPSPERTLTVFDLPKMYVEMYGVHNIEYQLADVVQSETDPNFIKELKARLDEHKVTMSQINMEIGAQTGMTGDAAGRRAGLDRLKRWIDIANQYGCKRLMLNQNQGSLTKERRADAVAYMKELADAGRPSGVMFSVETRGAGQPVGPDKQPADLGMKPWEFMIGIVKDAGAHSNVDIGNVGAMSQQELHDCIRAWHPYSSGNMHIKSSPYWSMGVAVRYAESLGYRGLYSLEINNAGHGAIRVAYNEVLAALA